MLQIRLLGQFDIRLDGKRVTISTRAGQSLLAYLALTAGTAHRREKIAGTFWPDTSDESARKNLRQELWRIRKALSIHRTNTEDYFTASDLTVTFNRDSEYWLDAAQVERPDLDLESLTTNLALYQGELLPGFYDEWIIIERERIQSIFDNKMGQLLEQLIASERWTAVQEQSERWLSMGNSIEPAYRGLMLAYGARGDMAKVSTIYQRCIADLDEKFGLEPSPETRALYDGLLKGSHVVSRTAQPSGTVTFLFTDIAGSTKLLDQLKDQYAIVLADHHKIMRAAIQKWNGREVDTQGDAFFVTFSRALDAVQCAAEAQREFASHKWVHNKPLRVRMGLHTGEPLLASTGYVGMDVHRAARIGDSGHGGQVLLSQTTRELVVHDLPEDLKIQNLGEHRLKDLRYPTPIHQLVIEGLPSEFPPLRTKFSGVEAPAPGEPPFKGLKYFDEVDSDLFYGRELLTAKLVNRLRETKFLSVVIGASGSGKSSLVRAGLIPALKNEKELVDGVKPPEGSSGWQVHIITPTAHPIEALAIELTRDSESLTAAATLMDDLMQDPRSLALFLARRNSEQHTLLVLDQFEELFTLCRDEFEREAFIDNLLTALAPSTEKDKHRDDGKITLILTLRADFYAHLAQYPELRDAVASQQEYIGPMTMEELRRAIEEPAKRSHWAFEPGLVDLILRDVGDEPGALPLLSHALLETWKRRAGHTMTLKGYADAGGVRGAIAHTAESVFENLSDDEQTIVRNIFVRLTELGEGTEDTRRRVSFGELLSNEENADEVRAMLNMLADARLVTLGEETAEVAHEALIREWPALREWLNQDREGLQLHRRLTETAREWELLEHDIGSLYQGARLAQANEWSARNPDALNAQERLFLDASNKQAEQEEKAREEQRAREATLKQRVQRVLQVLVGVLLIAAIVSGGLAFWANSQRQEALRQASIGLASPATLELEGTSPERSVLLALEALEKYPYTWQAERALGQIVHDFRLHYIVIGHKDTVMDIEWSPDGSKFATTGKDGTLRIWDAETRTEISNIPAHLAFAAGYTLGVPELAWSPDGTRVATAGLDKTAKVWDIVSGKEITSFSGHGDEVLDVAWSEDGIWVASSGKDGEVKVWDATTGAEKYSLPKIEGSVNSVAWSPDGTQIATAGDDGLVRIGNAETGEILLELSGHAGQIWSVAWSPDSTRITTASEDETVRVWNAKTGKEVLRVRLAGSAWDVAWSPDGTKLATTNADGRAQIWDAFSGKESFALQGHTPEPFDIAWSPDGKWLGTTAGSGFSARIWDASAMTLSLSTSPEGIIAWVSWSPDGKRVATVDTLNRTTVIWDAQTGTPLLSVAGHTADVQDVFWSPDGSKIVTTGWDNLAKVWDANTGEELLTFSGHVGEPVSKFNGVDSLFGGGWSPDGSRIVTDGGSGTVRVWDAVTGQEYFNFQATSDIGAPIRWSPDGTRLGSCSVPQVLQIWDAATGDAILGGYVNNTKDLSFGDNVDFCTWGGWSPDGSQFLTGSWAGNGATIWDANSGKKLSIFNELVGGVISTWSPDGKRIATGALNGQVNIWDAKSGAVLLDFSMPVGQYFLFQLDWSPDGTRLTGTAFEDAVEIYRVWQTKEDLIAYAKECCLVRELTPDERQQFGLP